MGGTSEGAREGGRSLEDIHSSVPIPRTWWRRFLAFSGPALLVSVGYMDPGNWGTDLEAGSRYGYRLLWVLLLSNLMALLLQTLATRLGVVTGRDLAQACRETYPRRTAVGLWLLTEIAIAATDLAEVIGTIIALKLLFGVPYLWGLVIAACDTALLLALQRRGVRVLEVVTLGLVAVIAGSFVFEVVLARPEWAAVLRGFLPGLARGDVPGSLYVAIGILGATVMPHNLYLHSALVQTRAFPQTAEGKRVACRYNFFDSLLALNAAFLINAAILILAAARFYPEPVESLQEAHTLLHQVWAGTVVGLPLAAVLFAVALLASGQSSTLTGTLAGQVVMEGFVRLRLRPWARRALTRTVAILPALLVVALTSASTDRAAVVDERLLQLLVLSQVVLSFQLPFAIIPLVWLTGDRRRMGEFASGLGLKALAWLCALVVVGLCGVLIVMQAGKWGEAVAEIGWSPVWVYASVGPTALAVAGFLGWVALYPWLHRRPLPLPAPDLAVRPDLAAVRYRRIGVAVEFTAADAAVLAHAAGLARSHDAALVLMHVVEGPGAAFYGPQTDDQESRQDRRALGELVEHLRREGLSAGGVLGYGLPAEELVRLSGEQGIDLLVLGTHGHRFLADLALGETVAPVLHRLPVPVLVVPSGRRSESTDVLPATGERVG
jgi:manganese transport protein